MTERPAILLRRAVRDDADAVLTLADQLSAFPVPPWRTARDIQRADDQVLGTALDGATPGTVAFVADGVDGLVGVVCLTTQTDYFTQEPVAHVEVLAVSAAAQGRGIARALMHEAEGWARERGFRHISLNVWAQNERARGLYEHLGYVPETMQYRKEL